MTPAATDPIDGLRVDLDLSWVRDGRGRLLRARTPEHRPAPLLAVGTTPDGTIRAWAASQEVPDAVVERLDAELPTAGADVTDRLLAVLGPHGRIERETAYVLAGPPRLQPLPADVSLRTSAEPDADEVRALVPARDRALTAPWAAAVVDGEVAAVCESARLAPDAAAAGVWTYAEHRRRGLAAAVTAAWAGLVDGTPHYGHDVENVASAGVARRVGFTPIGAWWWVWPPTAEVSNRWQWPPGPT